MRGHRSGAPDVLRLDIANIIGTSIDLDGFQLTQHDAEGEERAGAAAVQAHHLFGSWGRAPDAVVGPTVNGAQGTLDPSRAAQVLIMHEGGVGHAFDLQHVPTVGILPTPAPGEHLNYSVAGCFTRHHLDGSISHSTTDAGGAASGQTVAQRVTPTAFYRFAPWGRETFDVTGYRLKHSGGARFALGYVSGLPAPLSGGKSYARLQADILELNGSAVTIGPTGSVGQPVAQAVPLVTILTGIGTALTTIAAALASASPTSGITPAQTGAVTAAITAAQALIAPALAAISTQTAIG